MILYYLVAFSLSSQSYFDILGPILTTLPGEVGFWSMLGVSTNLKRSIHFSPDSNRQNGSICTRIPNNANEWDSFFQIQVKSGSLLYVVSDEVCPFWALNNNIDSFSGFILNITSIDDEKLSMSAQFLIKDRMTSNKLCNVDSSTATVKVSYKANSVEFFVENGTEYMKCGKTIPVTDLQKSYFTFFANGPYQNNAHIKNAPKLARFGNSELFYYEMKFSKQIKESENITEINHANKQLILFQQRQNRGASSHPILPVSSSVIKEMEKVFYNLNDDSLDKAQKEKNAEKIRDILIEINERLSESLTVEDLNKLIDATLTVNLEKAERKMEKKRKALQEISNDLNNLQADLTEKLQWLSNFAVESMQNSKEGAVNTLSKFLDVVKESEGLENETTTTIQDFNSTNLPTILYLISFVEFVCYIIFFIIQRKKTHGFVKID